MTSETQQPLNQTVEMEMATLPLPSADSFPDRRGSSVNRDEITGGSFTCILKGYPTVLTLDEMKDKAHGTHQVDVPREKRLSCCFLFVGLFFFILLFTIYFLLLTEFNYTIKDTVIIIMEICCVMSILIMGMCLFRWCSLNDISPKTIWQRVAVTQASPLRLIKFDMENVNISFVEYSIDYGEYPNNLHEPEITLTRQEQICNARDLVKITKLEPNPDEAYSYGAIYFHFKGQDEYLLDRWKYEFEKNHNKVANVFKKCNKFHSVFFQHFGYKFRYKVEDEDGREVKTDNEHEFSPSPAPGKNSKYVDRATTIREKEEEIMDILDSFAPSKPKSKVKEHKQEEEEEDFYMNTHDAESSTDERDAHISPILLGKKASHPPDRYLNIQEIPPTPTDNEQYVE